MSELNIQGIESHVQRLQRARVIKEVKQIEEDLKPGSGKIWKNQLTRPTFPRITGLVDAVNDNPFQENNNEVYEPMIISRDHTNDDPKPPRIKSLKRPVGPENLSASTSRSKRHAIYKTNVELQTKLTGSGNMLQHYMKSIERSTGNSILDELKTEHIYTPAQQLLPEYKQN